MDFNRSIEKAVNRRDFITGTTAGLVGALTLGTSAQAQQATTPAAPPQLAIPMTPGRVTYKPIEGDTIQIKGHQGDMIDAYMARPDGPGKFPGVVVVHHMPGWDEPTIEITRRFAQHGYAAICPNLHFREGKSTPEANSASITAHGGMPDTRTMGDVEGAIRHLRALRYVSGKVGIIGYCSGGRQVYLAACTLKGIDAAVACYPGGVGAGNVGLTPAMPIDPIDLTKDLSCPLMGIFGKDDKRPSPEHAAKIEAELKRLNKTYEIHSFENAGHSIFATNRVDYRPLAANEGWIDIFNWFQKYLA